MPPRYSMHGVMGAAERAVRLVTQYLVAREPLSRIHDVQSDPRFQPKGVDLLWEPQPGAPVRGVEVKGDRQAFRGNYFFELISNLEKQTPGCFLSSEADDFLYVFLAPREIHHLPLQATRAWFLEQTPGYPLRHTQTRIGPKEFYTTVGAIVPVKHVLEKVPGAARYRFDSEGELACG